MTSIGRLFVLGTVATLVGGAVPAHAQSPPEVAELGLSSGRILRLEIDQTISLKTVGQPVMSTLVEPVYAYDRIVLPAGAIVQGHVERIVSAPKHARVKAMLGGDFSPMNQAVLLFDSVQFPDGRRVSIQAQAAQGIRHLRRQVAGGEPSKRQSEAGRARSTISGQVREAIADLKDQKNDALAAIKEPGKGARLKDALIRRLPYHPQFLYKGTVYSAALQAPLALGTVVPVQTAPGGTSAPPDSILKARLLTALDSRRTPRGSQVEAEVTEPVFAADGALIFAEGARLEGEVTFAAKARSWHRNGQIRFLFERVQPAASQRSAELLASLYSVDTGQDDHVVLDDEGGAKVESSKRRFIAPALAVLALQGSLDTHREGDADAADPADVGSGASDASGHFGSRSAGGFFGLGLIGAAVSQLSRPVAVVLSVVGAAGTLYRNVLGKGSELSFPAGTSVQVRLAPAQAPGR